MAARTRGITLLGLTAVWLLAVGCGSFIERSTEEASQMSMEEKIKSRMDAPPRKVVVGTVLKNFWGESTDLDDRLPALCDLIDQVAEEAKRKYPGEGLDLVVLPEEALTGGRVCRAHERSVPLEGRVLDTLGAKAREHGTYLVAPMAMVDDAENEIYSNAAPLIGRDGEVVGVYRKVHPVSYVGTNELEEGMTPGTEFPVFDCDFGRLGIQICWDMSYPEGWEVQGRKGAEIIAWPTAAAQTMLPRYRALEHGYYIVSSTGGDNVSVFDPAGLILAQATNPENVLVQQIDLSYVVLHWSQQLRGGRGFTDTYGDRVGYNWSDRELSGVFWSNDPDVTIGQMAEELGVKPYHLEVERSRRLQDKVRGGPPER
jgi:predicted amidohydrolase